MTLEELSSKVYHMNNLLDPTNKSTQRVNRDKYDAHSIQIEVNKELSRSGIRLVVLRDERTNSVYIKGGL